MIDHDDIERLKEIFVTRKECDDVQEDIRSKLNKDGSKLAVIETKISMVLWVLAAVGTGVISIVLKMFLGG
nr:MAG TPA: hypothetical protein [Caudoviricetes sp.]